MSGVPAVIPNWNGRAYLEPLFADLAAQTRSPSRVIVVDNGSTDGSPEWAESQGATVIRFGTNRGFAGAVNTGVDAARSDHVAVLNSDLRLRPDWLEKLSAGIGDASFATGKLLRLADPRVIDGTFDCVCRGAAAWRAGEGRPDGPLWSEPRRIQFPPFTAVLLQREAFTAVGGLDESLESYLEDVDFGFRCASHGHTGVYLPDAVAYHAGSGTLGRWHPRTVRQISRNQVLLLARHYPGSLLARFGWRIALAQCLWGIVAVRHGAGGAWLRGKVQGLGMFRRQRQPGDRRIAAVLEASEADIQRLQEASGMDLFWRLYFALT